MSEAGAAAGGGRREALRGALVGVAAICLAAPLLKLAAPTHPLVSAATRLTLAGLLWLPFALRDLRRAPLDRAHLRVGLLAAPCYAVHFGAWIWSLDLTSVSSSTTLVTTTPLGLGLAAALTGRDALSRRAWLGAALAALGVGLLAARDAQGGAQGSSPLLGDALALLGAAAMGVYLWSARALGGAQRLAPLSLLATLGGGLLLWAVCLLALPAERLALPRGDAALALLGAALVPQMVGHAALTRALRALSATEVGLLTLLEPAGASALAYLWLGEPTPPAAAAACALTLAGVAVALWARERPNNPI